MNCTYEFEPNEDQSIALEFDFFHTEEEHDFVEVWQTQWKNGSVVTAVKQAM